MPRTPNPDEVLYQLEQVLADLRDGPDSSPVFLANGAALAYDTSYLINSEGSLGPVARLMLLRCKLRTSAKQLQAEYRHECEQQGCQTTNYTALQYAFSLTTTQLKTLPPTSSLAAGFGALLNQWRAKHGNNGLGLPPHPELDQLFDKSFVGSDACTQFLAYLEYSSSPATQLASGRRFNTSADRDQVLDKVVGHAVHGEAMLINVHAEAQWDGLRAFSESLASRIAVAEATFAQSLKSSTSHVQRDVLFVPLRAIARPANPGSEVHDPVVPDEHMGLDRLMGILRAFVDSGSAADVLNAQPMEDEVGFSETLHRIRESLMMTARIFVFDSVYEADFSPGRQTLERVIADEHFLFVLKRMMEPLLASTDDPHALDVFNRNRFIITSNSEHIADRLWSASLNADKTALRKPPVSEPLRTTDAANYHAMLEHSIEHAQLVVRLLRSPVLSHCRNDVVNQLLNSVVSLLAELSAIDQSSARESEITAEVDLFSGYLKPSDLGMANVSTVVDALLAYLRKQSNIHAEFLVSAEPVDKARLWSELLLLLALLPEGLTLETIDRLLMRLTMMHENIEHPLPSLQKAKDAGSLDAHIVNFAHHANSIVGFIRREYVEGPEVEDHPLEYWEGLSETSEFRERNKGLTLDFRYPEIRSSLQQSRFWDLLAVDRYLLHRVISEIALQYQTTYFRHTDYRHRGSVRNWRRLITSLYHGLASIGHPDLSTHKHYGVRGADADGSSLEYWLFLYAKQYRQIMEGPALWRISRVMGLDDLKTSILEVFSKPWLLHSHLLSTSNVRFPRFLDHFAGSSQPAAEYYLTRMRGALARGEVENAYPGWYDRFRKIKPSPTSDDQLRMEYALLDKRLQTVESTSTEHVIDVLHEHTGTGEAFRKLQLIAHDPDTDEGIVTLLPSVGHTNHEKIPGLISFVDMPRVTEQVKHMLDIVGRPSTVAMALNYYGTLSRFESDRADFSEGYQHSKRIPEGLKEHMREDLENTLTLNGPECRQYRRLALARLILVEAARVALFRLDPTGTGFTRSNAQGRTAVRLAIKLDDEFRQQLSLAKSVPSAYFRFARRMSDSCTRMAWQFPREQSNALIIEASMLRSESNRITDSSQITEQDAALAQRLLMTARATIGRSERVLTTPNLASRARLRMTLERYKLNRDIAAYHRRFGDKELARVFRQHSQYDLSMLRGAVETSDARPYWKLIVGLQRDMEQSV